MRVVAVATCVLLGCGGAGPSSPAGSGETTPPPPIVPTGEQGEAGTPLEAFVEARATAATEERAEAEARAALRERVLGDAATLSTHAVHDPRRDPRLARRTDAGVEVWLGLSEERVREALAAAGAEGVPPPSLPSPLGPPVEVFLRASLQRALCERQRALGPAECTVPDVEALGGQVRQLAARVRLRPAHEGGVPVGTDRRPLRAARVMVEYQAPDRSLVPVAGLPVVARAEPGGPAIHRAFSDEEGRAELALARDEPLTGSLLIEIDRSTLPPAVAALWPEQQVRLGARPPSLQRWTGVARERVAGRASPDAGFLEGLHAAMRRAVSRSPMSLEEDTRARLLAARGNGRAQLLATLADDWAGRVDYLLVGEARSEFASRMGQDRVWYQAQGSLEAIDIWTGRIVARVEASVTQPGLGDERAARAAHRALAERLVEQLVQALRTQDRIASLQVGAARPSEPR